MNPAIVSLIIEARQAEYESLRGLIQTLGEVMQEAQQEPGLDEGEKKSMKDKSDVIFSLLDELHDRHERDIEEIKHRYRDQCSDISINYLTDLPGWTRSA